MARCRANAASPKPSCLQGCAVVAVQHGAHRLGMHPLGERRSPGQVSSMLGTVSVMHLIADDLAAVEVEDQVEVEPASLDLRRQERQTLSAKSGGLQNGWAEGGFVVLDEVTHVPSSGADRRDPTGDGSCRARRLPQGNGGDATA